MRRVLSVVLLSVVVATAQQPRSFDVASVKELPKSGPFPTDIDLHINATSAMGTTTLAMLVFRAYAPLQSSRISGFPSWATSVFYDVKAKSETPSSPEDMRMMFRTLLADRFSLKVHWETREMNYRALVAVTGKTKLKPLDPDTEEPAAVTNVFHPRNCQGVADLLSQWMGTTVVDETRISGDYDITLDLRNENYRQPDGHMPRGVDLIRAAGDAMARQVQQFGLKLEQRKGPLDVLIIDQALRPSEN